MADVSDVLARQAPGAVLGLEVADGAQRRTLQATLALRPANVPAE